MIAAALAKPITCVECGEEISFNEKDCFACGASAGFPNVRAAEADAEQNALRNRVASAEQAATLKGVIDQLKAFGETVSSSSIATMAKSIQDLDAFLSSGNYLLTTFYKLVRAKARKPQDNAWDRVREAADSTIHPLYKDDIQYAALSLNGIGVHGYGGCFVLLKDLMISKRSSCFEENPILFCDRYNVTAGSQPPPGFRSTWSQRGDLAKAKLHSKFSPTTTAADFADILLENGHAVKSRDFIEVHIYGAISIAAVAKVWLPPRPGGPERHLWQSVRRRLSAHQVAVEVY